MTCDQKIGARVEDFLGDRSEASKRLKPYQAKKELFLENINRLLKTSVTPADIIMHSTPIVNVDEDSAISFTNMMNDSIVTEEYVSAVV